MFDYCHYFHSHCADPEKRSVPSAELAAFFDVDATQVRKDFAAAGIPGRPRVGYARDRAMKKLRTLIGIDASQKAVVVGAGRIGSALARYKGFAGYGIDFFALFDDDPEKAGKAADGRRVYPMKSLEKVVKKHDVRIAVIAVPVHARAV